jgi:D-alanyl-D-alanine carboxypeptidase
MIYLLHKKFLYRFLIFLSSVTLLFTLFVNNTEILVHADEQWPAYPNIYAEAGVLIEASTGTVLYDKNCHQKMYPASITKIMTTLLALENGNLSDMVEFYHYDVFSLELGDAHISRQEGELLSLKDCLYAVMLASANEVANAVGEYVARNTSAYTDKINELKASNTDYDESKVAIDVFADMMNERAKELGAIGTHFANPNGLFDEDHYTTCYDMAMITRAAVANDEFLKIESNTTYTIPATNLQSETHPIANRHQMLFPNNSVYYDGILGGKTGYVDQSGTTLVTFAKRNGMTLIAVVMKSNGANVYNDTKLLLDYGFNNFSLSNISEQETTFSFNNTTSYSNLDTVFGTNTPLIELNPEGNVVLPNGVTLSDCKSELTFLDSSEQTGNNIAKINYFYNDINVGGTTLILNSNSEEDSFTFGPTKTETSSSKNKSNDFININIWLMLVILLIIIFVFLVFRYTRMRQRISHTRRHKKHLRQRKRNRNRRSRLK